MKKRFLRSVLSFVLILSLTLFTPSSAYAILSSDDEIEDLWATTNWDTDLLTAQEWTVSTKGESYSITRESFYVEDYYKDILTTTKEYLGLTEAFGGGSQIVAVAKGELGQPGTVETGGNNLVKYTNGSWSRWPYGAAQWCAIFVLWCADQCGYLDSGLFPSNVASAANTGWFLRWFIDQGYEYYDMAASQPYSSTGYVPSPGDIMFYKQRSLGWSSYYNGPAIAHVAIVTEVNLDEGYIVTVEGNRSNMVREVYHYTAAGYGDGCWLVNVPYPAEDGEQGIYNFLISYGLNSAAACGILANMYVETGGTFDPSIEEYGNRIGYGLCQWSFERRTSLVSWCNRNGYDASSTHGQMMYLVHELETSYSSVLSQLKSVSNSAAGAYQAASIFCTGFERPANTSSQASYRGRLAQNMFWPTYGS